MPLPVRVASLSFWHVHAGDYTRSTQQHRDTELVAIWDDDAERGAEAAATHNTVHVTDLDALLAREDLDAVTVTTETSRHRDVMVAAARAGKHIFTEKLLAPTVSEAEEIVAACRDHDVALVVSLPRLSSGWLTTVRDLVASGRLGTLTHARVRLSHNGSVADWLPERFYDREPAIGGALTDLGCHPVYLVQTILGTHPTSVQATYTEVTGRGVEDNAVVTLGYASGAIGVVEAGFVAPTPFQVEVAGTDGWLSYTDHDDAVVFSGATRGEEPQRLPIPVDAPSPYQQWIQCIADGTHAVENQAAAVELTRLVVAANEAAATGRTVSYP